MQQLFCLLNQTLPCLTDVSNHIIFSFSRIRSHDVQMNISVGNQTLRLDICNPVVSPPSLFFFCFVPHTVSQVLTYAVISSMGQWADNRTHKRLCQKGSGLICTSYQITM